MDPPIAININYHDFQRAVVIPNLDWRFAQNGEMIFSVLLGTAIVPRLVFHRETVRVECTLSSLAAEAAARASLAAWSLWLSAENGSLGLEAKLSGRERADSPVLRRPMTGVCDRSKVNSIVRPGSSFCTQHEHIARASNCRRNRSPNTKSSSSLKVKHVEPSVMR